MKQLNPRFAVAFGLAGLGLLAACVIPVIFNYSLSSRCSNEVVSLTVLALGGVLGLIAVLGLVACIFAALDMGDRGQALGLPEGTIRAVIALSLIVIFVISSLFLFGRLSESTVGQNFTEQQKNAVPGAELLDATREKDGSYTVKRAAVSKAGEDFAKQLLTTISTLVVSIASFYFGTKAVTSATSAQNKGDALDDIAPPKIGQVSPAAVPRPDADTDVSLTVTGENLQAITVATLTGPATAGKNEVKQLDAQSLTVAADRVIAVVTIPPNAAAGAWKLSLGTATGENFQKEDAFTIQ